MSDLFRTPPQRFLDLGAGEAAYRCVGEGPDVLFVHGWPLSGATFRHLVPHLAEHVRCHVIDLPGAGDSRFDDSTTLTVQQHARNVNKVVDLLGLESVAVVGHDSGGLIARHAMAGDPRLRAMGLIDSETTPRISRKFTSFIALRRMPGLEAGLRFTLGQPRLVRSSAVFGGAFVDKGLLAGEFDELFLAPLRDDPARLRGAVRLLRNFDLDTVKQLPEVHARIGVPVRLVWGAKDPFFPVAHAQEMVGTFADAELTVIDGAALMSHEERPAEVAAALLPVLTAPPAG
jgi:pimeloyl-ACP methyl ester carboxylesterase